MKKEYQSESLTFTLEESIIHHLIIKTPFQKDLSLFNGRMGIAVAFFNYGRYKEKDVFTNFAEDLIDGVLTKLDRRFGFEFATGLSGIGWAIEYLIQNNFVECNSNDACKEIDDIVMSIDIKRINNLSLKAGIEGILHYILARIKGTQEQKTQLPFDSIYLEDVKNVLINIDPKRKIESFNFLIYKFIHFMGNRELLDYNLNIESLYTLKELEDSEEITDVKLGLDEGLAGKLLYNSINTIYK